MSDRADKLQELQKKLEKSHHCMLISNKKILFLVIIGIFISLAAVSIGVTLSHGFIRELLLTRQSSEKVHFLDKLVETYVVCYDGKEYFVPFRGSVTPVYTDHGIVKACTVETEIEFKDE